MSTRRTRNGSRLPSEFENELLTELGVLRYRLCRIMPYEDIWPATYRIVQAIDGYAAEMTGNAQYFHSKAP
jgi:hypothetical protein